MQRSGTGRGAGAGGDGEAEGGRVGTSIEHAMDPGITELHLGGNDIGAEGCAHLATALQSEHCKVNRLNLFNNYISAEGCAHLATALQSEHCKVHNIM